MKTFSILTSSILFLSIFASVSVAEANSKQGDSVLQMQREVEQIRRVQKSPETIDWIRRACTGCNRSPDWQLEDYRLSPETINPEMISRIQRESGSIDPKTGIPIQSKSNIKPF